MLNSENITDMMYQVEDFLKLDDIPGYNQDILKEHLKALTSKERLNLKHYMYYDNREFVEKTMKDAKNRYEERTSSYMGTTSIKMEQLKSKNLI
jgi:hypothetical protein